MRGLFDLMEADFEKKTKVCNFPISEQKEVIGIGRKMINLNLIN